MVMQNRALRDVRRSRSFSTITGLLGNKQYKPEKGDKPQEAPIFGTIRELLCFAALLGFKLECRESLEGEPLDESVPEEVFSKNEDALACVRMIALAEEQDAGILGDDRVDEMVTIFEEYAHGGLKIIQKFLMDMPTDILGVDAIIHGMTERGLFPERKVQINQEPTSEEPTF